MKRQVRYRFFFLLPVGACIFAACNFRAKGDIRIPKLSPKYSYRDREPMGSYIAYHYLNSLFQKGIEEVRNKSFSEHWYELKYSNSFYFILSRSVFLSRFDMYSMLNYVKMGNTLMLSAAYIDEQLLDTLGIDMDPDFLQVMNFDEYRLEKSDTWVSLADTAWLGNKQFGIFYLAFKSGFSFNDSSGIQVLGHNENGKPNFLAVNYGNGKIILHAAPAAFSNYFLLKPGNPEYLEKVFSYINPETEYIYWDNYYRLSKGTKDFSILKFLKQHPALYYAFLLALALLLLYLAFGGKRKQRIVAEKFPVVNSTVSYAETIGRLYLQKKDNLNIARKMITYFLEHVRNYYYINTQLLNNDFAEALARKCNQPPAKAHYLLQLMGNVESGDNITDISLLELHNHLQEFIKK